MFDLSHALSFDTSRYRVLPDSKINLSEWDTNEREQLGKATGREATAQLNYELEEAQELMYAQARHKVLIVLQGTDTAGKDGTIRHVFEHVNPQGVDVASFKKPSSLELSHDYLWRIHKKAPRNGQIVIFNRSHYEDVLVVRVHNLVEKQRWERRYHHIREFERMLADEGTTILKFYLHISRDEQRERLQERLDIPAKNWKFSKADLAEREHWDAYQDAFTEMLQRTSTNYAPWFIIPADRKWFRNLLISRIVVDTLKNLKMRYPAPEPGLTDLVIPV